MLCPDSYFTLRSLTAEACQVKKKTKLNSDLNRIPFSLFIQVVSEFCSWRIPIFLKCYVIFAKCAFAWEQIRAILENNLNSSLKLFILLFIPPCLMQAALPSFLSLQGTDLCAAAQFLHCIGLFPSTCAHGVGAPFCYLPAVQPQTHSSAFHSHSYFIVASCDVFRGRGSKL